MPVTARDGEIGHVLDLLFDAQTWQLLYLEAATGWLFGRNVIVPVQKATRVDVPGGPVHFDLAKDRIKESPALTTGARLDEAFETRLLAYYGIAETARRPERTDPVSHKGERGLTGWLAPMRAGELDGYELAAEGENVGTVQDIFVDLDGWRVTSLIANVGGVVLPDIAEIGIGSVVGLNRHARIVHVAISKQAVARLTRLRDDEPPYVPPEDSST